VKSVLGIPSGPIQVEQLYVDPESLLGKNCRPNQIYGRKWVKSIYPAGSKICTETEEGHFCIAFIMKILAIYLAPNRISISFKPFFGAAQQVDKLSQMDWCNFTASYLFEGIKEFKQSNMQLVKVKGCVHILSVRNIPTALVEISYSFGLKNCCNVLMFFYMFPSVLECRSYSSIWQNLVYYWYKGVFHALALSVIGLTNR
jgi:hypothetical protein